MHGNQWVLKIAVLKYYSVSKRGTTAKSNPKQATDPISLHTKFGDNRSNTFPLNERKPCVTPDIRRRTSGGEKSKNNISTPQGGGHNSVNKYSCSRNYIFAELQPVTSLWNYFYNRIPRIIMYISNDAQQRVFIHCAFPVFMMLLKHCNALCIQKNTY